MEKRIVHWVPRGTLNPYQNNPMEHPKGEIEEIKGSMQRWGWTNPILVNNLEQREIIAGHARLIAANELGLEEVSIIPLDSLSVDDQKAYRIFDNKVAMMAKFEQTMLTAEFSDLKDAGYDLSFTGFTMDEIAKTIDMFTDSKEDETPDPPEKAITKRGDLYLLGNHRLLCGDSTSGMDVGKLLGGASPQLMVTDPPYGVNYNPDLRADQRDIRATQPERDRIKNDHRSDWTETWQLFPGTVAYVWHAALYGADVANNLQDAGFTLRSQIIWAKNRFAMSRGNYHWQHEPCFYAVRDGKTSQWTGSRTQSTVWNIDVVQNLEMKHPNQKPVECMRRPVINNSNPGQAVYDPFAGTGTTLMACEMTGRACYTMELDQKFCDVIVQRWQQFTGRKAEKE